MGELMAWDPIAGKKVWTITDKYPTWSGTVATAGDLVFFGTLDGWFKAADARTGKILWQFKTGSGIIGQPVTYRGPDGKQYVAILSGVGGWPGSIVSANLDTRDDYRREWLGQRHARSEEVRRSREGRSMSSRFLRSGRVARASAGAVQRASAMAQARCGSAPIRTTCRSRIAPARGSTIGSRL